MDTRRVRRKRAFEAVEESKVENIDFKMVTFSLAGKDYGIDIMKVKEIAKFVNFTYVPNTPAYVRGVYNLRGEIISIIDLREMFNLPYERDDNSDEENGLILRLETNMIGVVVDKIDKVIGISSDTIQPPHPIFGDINIKYISGVVENEDRLYIILDVERILGNPEEQADRDQQATPAANSMQDSSASVEAPRLAPKPAQRDEKAPQAAPKAAAADNSEINKQFIRETLVAYEGFYSGPLNQDWFDARFDRWKVQRGDGNLQLESQSDAASFMEGFASPYSGRLWEPALFEELYNALPASVDNQLHVWNPGCGKGYETYSIACLLRKKYPSTQIKIWASDKDLLAVSSAPNLVFSPGDVPEVYREFTVEGPNGLSFNQTIKDSILFEYHDIVNAHAMPPIQLLIARDLFSFIPPENSARMFEELDERMKTGGIVILGNNEIIPATYQWSPVVAGKLRYFTRK